MQILRKPAEFSAVLQSRKRLSLPASLRLNAGPGLLDAYVHYPDLEARSQSEPAGSGWRLGLVISRKAAPLAVQRNWLKRQIRAICREQETEQRIDLDFRARQELKQHYLEAKQKRQLRVLRDRVRDEILAYLAGLKK